MAEQTREQFINHLYSLDPTDRLSDELITRFKNLDWTSNQARQIAGELALREYDTNRLAQLVAQCKPETVVVVSRRVKTRGNDYRAPFRSALEDELSDTIDIRVIDTIRNTPEATSVFQRLDQVLQIKLLNNDQVMKVLTSLRSDLVALAPEAAIKRTLQSTYVDAIIYIFSLYSPKKELPELDQPFMQGFTGFTQSQILRQATAAVISDHSYATISPAELSHLAKLCGSSARGQWEEHMSYQTDGDCKDVILKEYEKPLEEAAETTPPQTQQATSSVKRPLR